MIARRVLVHGLVQGVGFRYTCAREAALLGVHGWVRNRADGAVEAHLEGPSPAVQEMVAWAHRGPPYADVTRVDVREADPQGLATFAVE